MMQNKIKKIQDEIRHHEHMKDYVIKNIPRHCNVKCKEIDGEIKKLKKELEKIKNEN